MGRAKTASGAPACFLSGISGWRDGSLDPLARGGRRSWRGEVEKYGFGGAVADFVLVISGSRRRPRRSQGRRSQVRVSFATTRSQQLAEGVVEVNRLSWPRVNLNCHP